MNRRQSDSLKHSRGFSRLLMLSALCIAGLLATGQAAATAASTVEVQILSLAGWRGQVEPLSGEIGGAATIAAYWQRDRAANPNTLALAVGNSFGTSPPVSRVFNDQPAVEALNTLGVNADTLGHDNFDAGLDYLQALIDGAQFPFVAANIKNLEGNLVDVPPYTILGVGGIRVAVIGVMDPASPSRVFPGNFGSIEVTNPVLAALEAREAAEKAGADIFVLITELGFSSSDGEPPAGDLYEIVSRLEGFDLILGDESDLNRQAEVNGALVVESKDRGASYARTTLTFEKEAGTVVASKVDFVEPAAAGVEPDPEVAALIDAYAAQLAETFGTVIAYSETPLSHGDVCGEPDGRTCESLAGNLIADALRAAYTTDFALINSGAIRADLTCVAGSLAGFCPDLDSPPLPITVGQIEAALPFANFAVVTQVSGPQLKLMLENSVAAMPNATGRFAQISGFCFVYDISRPSGTRVISVSRQDHGGVCESEELDLSDEAAYSLATVDFIAAGGDGYEAVGGEVRDPLTRLVGAYLESSVLAAVASQGRISCASSGSLACPTVTGLAAPAGITPPSTGDAGLSD